MTEVRDMLKRDLSVTLRDARAGLAQWGDALRDIRDNPLYALLRRTWAKRGPRHPLLKALSYMPPLFVLAGLSTGIGLVLLKVTGFPGTGHWLVTALMVAVPLYLVWLGMGLYHITVDALIFLGRPGSRSGDELQLDESLMGVRLGEHEILAAVVLALVPRIWLRWLTAPVVTLGVFWLEVAAVQRQDAPAYSMASTWWPGLREVSLPLLSASAPLTCVLLYLYAIPVAAILVLFMVAMGRSLDHRWQIQLLAACISFAQLTWIPWSFFHLLSWRTKQGYSWNELGQTMTLVVFPLLALGLLVAALHFTRRVPWARLAIAAAIPVLNGVVLLIAYQQYLADRVSLLDDWWEYVFSWSWASSAFCLFNPLAIPFRQCLGVPAAESGYLLSLQWHRFPGIWFIQLCALLICAHAARLAVQDLRRSEE